VAVTESDSTDIPYDMLTSSFASLVSRYRVIFFDAYGVLKNARGILNGVPELLSWILQQGKDVYVITNDASRSPAQMAAAYAHPQHGILIPESKIISSGLLAKDFLRAKLRSGRVAYLGKPASAFYIESAGVTPVHIGACNINEEVDAVALLDDEGFDWFRDLNVTLNMIRRVNAPVIVANPDLVYPVNDREVGLAVGSLASMLERIVGKAFIRFGKPDTMMFSHAFACAHENVPHLRRSDVLMVGDTLETDIIGANTFGLDTALVLSGNTRAEQAALLIQAKGIIPTYLCESVFT
jgi:HAD superfamily hydrolase (TIGR01450 family)